VIIAKRGYRHISGNKEYPQNLQGSFMYSTGWWIFHMAPRVDIGQHSDFLVKIYMFITQLSFNDRARKILPESHIQEPSEVPWLNGANFDIISPY
jgi:hypothetical protein